MSPVYVPMPRANVITWLGPAYPPRPGAPLLRVPESAGVTDGGVAVYPVDGQPGVLWWLVDSCIYPQDAGPVDETLAALVPGSHLGTVPGDDAPDSPPVDTAPDTQFAAPL